MSRALGDVNSWWIQLLVPMGSDDFLSKRQQDTSGYLLLNTEQLLLPFGLHKDLLATGRPDFGLAPAGLCL